MPHARGEAVIPRDTQATTTSPAGAPEEGLGNGDAVPALAGAREGPQGC